jgi:hypothetical protein
MPFLMTWNLIERGKKFRFHINLGSYPGYGNVKSNINNSDHYYLKRFDYGLDLLTGIGSNKWQVSFYVMQGLRNRATRVAYFGTYYDDVIKKIISRTIGFDMIQIRFFKYPIYLHLCLPTKQPDR